MEQMEMIFEMEEEDVMMNSMRREILETQDFASLQGCQVGGDVVFYVLDEAWAVEDFDVVTEGNDEATDAGGLVGFVPCCLQGRSTRFRHSWW